MEALRLMPARHAAPARGFGAARSRLRLRLTGWLHLARAQPAPMNQVILLEDGWNKLKTGGVMKIEQILEDMQGGVYKNYISTEEYSTLYTCAACRARVPARAALLRPPPHLPRDRRTHGAAAGVKHAHA